MALSSSRELHESECSLNKGREREEPIKSDEIDFHVISYILVLKLLNMKLFLCREPLASLFPLSPRHAPALGKNQIEICGKIEKSANSRWYIRTRSVKEVRWILIFFTLLGSQFASKVSKRWGGKVRHQYDEKNGKMMLKIVSFLFKTFRNFFFFFLREALPTFEKCLEVEQTLRNGIICYLARHLWCWAWSRFFLFRSFLR